MTPSQQPVRRIRVLMVMPSYYPIVGGMEIQVARQIPFLREHGIDVTILTRKPTESPRVDHRDGVEIRRIPVVGGAGLRSISFTAMGAADIVRHWREIDIIHAHSLMSPATIAAISGVPLHKPRIVTVHQSYETDHLMRKPLGRQRLAVFSRTISRFIAISSDIERLLLQHGVPASRIASVPNGINTDTFSPVTGVERETLRADLGLPVDIPIAVFAGRLQPVKNVDILLRAWAGTEHGYLLILGDGDERRSLETLASELRLGNRVEFRGMVANVSDFLRIADIFVLPSSSEGLSVALLEAMSSGLVPVATAIGGTVDVVQDQETGLLTLPGDVDGLRTALIQALTNDVWRQEIAQRVRTSAVTNYDLRVIATKLAGVYHELVD